MVANGWSLTKQLNCDITSSALAINYTDITMRSISSATLAIGNDGVINAETCEVLIPTSNFSV